MWEEGPADTVPLIAAAFLAWMSSSSPALPSLSSRNGQVGTLKLPRVEWKIHSRSTHNMAVSDDGDARTEAEDRATETHRPIRNRNQGRVLCGC